MQLSVPFKQITIIPKEYIDAIESSLIEEDWFTSDYRQAAGNMSGTNTIPVLHTPLCAVSVDGYQAISDIKEEKLYSKYSPLINPIIEILKEHYTFNKYACFLARLAPNSNIGMHKDRGLFLELCNRIHVPIVTNPKVKYVIDSQNYYWEKGKVYEFDNTRIHGVRNESNDYRIHLVINLYNLSEKELEAL